MMRREEKLTLMVDPRRHALLERADVLRREFIRLYTRRDMMMVQERETLNVLYISLIGRRKYENFCLSVEVRSLRLKLELAQAALNHNRQPDLDAIDREIDARLSAYREDMERRAEAIRAAESAEAISHFCAMELRELYHTLVRRLHPDLHPEQSDDRRDLFMKGMAAYRSFDLDTLREVVKRLDMDGGVDEMVRDAECIEDVIARLERDIAEMKAEVAAMRESFPFNIEMQLQDPIWIKAQSDELEQERRRLLEQKDMYEDRLDLLLTK